MGAEAICTATYQGNTAAGKARLETDTLYFRGGDLTLRIPFAAMKNVAARDGLLELTAPGGTALFELGAAAAKWADKIRHPRSRLMKMGLKPDWRVSAVGPLDQTFLAELEGSVKTLIVGRITRNSDAIVFGLSTLTELSRLGAITRALKPAGALWIVRPKGHAEITERAMMTAGRAAGLVDVKVVAFSATHTAEKFVIRVKDRQP
jgi:hypothetical protein